MNKSSNKEGSALVLAVAFVVLTSLLSGAVLYSGMSHFRLADRQANLEKALYVAEGGLEMAGNYLSEKRGFAGNLYSASGSIGYGSYSYSMSNTGWRTYSITSQGTVDGVSREITIARAWLPSYAQYALWMDENGKIYFKSGETFFGDIHSNDKLWFSGTASAGGPTFWEEVTSADDKYGGSLDYVTFHEGFELEADAGSMADVDFDSADWSSLNNLADNFGLVLKGRTSITFNGDEVLVTNTRKGWTDHPVTLGPDEIIYVEDAPSGSKKKGEVILNGGTVDGQLTIAADDDIYITDHIRYADDPSDDTPSGPQSDDSLGLISKDDVWITKSAPDNLDIFAAIMATGKDGKGSFGVLDYNKGSPRGSLNVYGSIVQEKRGAVGTFSTKTQKSVSGYSKNYSYDERFAVKPPPYYPALASEVRFEGWEDAAL